MFGWLVGSLREVGIFSLCFSLLFFLEKRGVFIAFRAAQPHTVEHSNAQLSAAMHSRAQSSAAMHSHAQSMHSRAQQCTVDAQSSAAMHSRAQSSAAMHSRAQSCTVELAATLKCPNALISKSDVLPGRFGDGLAIKGK